MAEMLTSENFAHQITESTIPVVVDVFATWCGPCRQVMPIFEELSKELAGSYSFLKLNIDEERDLAIQYNVSSVPTFLFIKDGKLVAKATGYMTKETLKAKIESTLK